MAKKGTITSIIHKYHWGGENAIKSVVTRYKRSSWKIYSGCMKFYLSSCINTWSFIFLLALTHGVLSFSLHQHMEFYLSPYINTWSFIFFLALTHEVLSFSLH